MWCSEPSPSSTFLVQSSGHVDFAVVSKADLHPVIFGKVNCHELLDANKGKKRILLHQLVNKLGRMAKHYDAEVVVGKLHSSYTNHRHQFNRRIQGMNQFELRRILEYKLPLKGISLTERSEAYTSKLGAVLSRPLGLDVHKASAYALAVKVLDYGRFQSLLHDVTSFHEAGAYEGDGIPSIGGKEGSPLTVAHRLCLTQLMRNDLGLPPSEAALNQGKSGVAYVDLQTHILQVKV